MEWSDRFFFFFVFFWYSDSDGIQDNEDNCPYVANNPQLDTDRDGFGMLDHNFSWPFLDYVYK